MYNLSVRKSKVLIDSDLPHYLYMWFKSIQIKDGFLPTHTVKNHTQAHAKSEAISDSNQMICSAIS